MAGNPRKLQVPGETEHAAKISQNVVDPDEWRDRHLLVFGAGDVACEAAIALADRGNRVTMAAPDKEFTYPKKRNVDAVTERVRAGTIKLHLSHKAVEIRENEVDIAHTVTGEKTTVPCDHMFRCIGADLPLKFFDRIGVKLERTWDLRRYAVILFAFLICYTIYGVKKPAWPFAPGDALQSWPAYISLFTPKIMGQAVRINPVFWYAFAYSLVMTVFGIKAYYRWGVAYNDAHQKKRYISLIVTQWTLGFLIPGVVMYWIHHKVGDNMWLGASGNYWHAFGLELPFPLYFSMFFYDVGLLYLIYGLLVTFIVIPILSIFHGKRYCTWICGCGGLAETLGDCWRHLSPKGKVSRRWEWMNTAVMIWAFVAAIFVLARVGFGIHVGGSKFAPPGGRRRCFPATAGSPTTGWPPSYRSRSIRSSAARSGAAIGVRWRSGCSYGASGSAGSESSATKNAYPAVSVRVTVRSASTSWASPRTSRISPTSTRAASTAAYASPSALWTY